MTPINLALRKGATSLALALVISVVPSLVRAYDSYENLIPNGHAHAVQCAACHLDTHVDCDVLTGFGQSFKDEHKTWTLALAMMDSDSDGYPNGEELGDTLGLWVARGHHPPPAPATPPGGATNPADPTSFPPYPARIGTVHVSVQPAMGFDASLRGGTAHMSITLPTMQRAQVSVYDLMGRAVSRVLSATLPRGTTKFDWHPDVASGCHYVVLTTPTFQRATSLVVIR